MKKEFNPTDWIEKPTAQNTSTPLVASNSSDSDIEKLITEIESKKIDLTTSYENWLQIGFALADSFQESGRNYYHQLSQFHIGYNQSECNTQYDNCLKANKQGITIKTLFHLAKQAGVIIKPEIANKPNQQRDGFGMGLPTSLPTFPISVYNNLPELLKNATSIASSKEEMDILLLGSIVSISACLNNLFGYYDQKKTYCNLYLFVTAQASAGKGRLVHCKQLVKPIHLHLREQAKRLKNQYELELMTYHETKSKDSSAEKPTKPPEKMLFLPANSSSSGLFQLLNDNDGCGLMFETEGDTLANTFKTDYGNYSDGFRKSFHNETISYYRKTDREYVDIDNPRLSGVFSGTPKQVASLIPNAENGLFSRFIFYFMNVHPNWKNVFATTSENGLDEYFDLLGIEFFALYQTLYNNPEIQFQFTAEQEQKFNLFFEQIQTTYLDLQGMDYMATVRRLGLISFRIAMILSALRILETGNLPQKLICEERDFQTSLELIKVLVKHSSKVFSELPEDIKLPKRKNQKEKFFDALPSNFNRQEYLKTAATFQIPEKTAEGYITDFYKSGILHREKKDNYIKPTQETKDIQETQDLNQKDVSGIYLHKLGGDV